MPPSEAPSTRELEIRLTEALARLHEKIDFYRQEVEDGRAADKELARAELTALAKAVDTAKSALDQRLEKDNEVRAQLDRQARDLLSIARFEEFTKTLDLRAEEVTRRLGALERAEAQRRGGISVTAQVVAWSIGVIGLVIGALTFFFHVIVRRAPP